MDTVHPRDGAGRRVVCEEWEGDPKLAREGLVRPRRIGGYPDNSGPAPLKLREELLIANKLRRRDRMPIGDVEHDNDVATPEVVEGEARVGRVEEREGRCQGTGRQRRRRPSLAPCFARHRGRDAAAAGDVPARPSVNSGWPDGAAPAARSRAGPRSARAATAAPTRATAAAAMNAAPKPAAGATPKPVAVATAVTTASPRADPAWYVVLTMPAARPPSSGRAPARAASIAGM